MAIKCQLIIDNLGSPPVNNLHVQERLKGGALLFPQASGANTVISKWHTKWHAW